MDKIEPSTMLYRPPKRPVKDLNSCITCNLCKGYFIDATTIIECLHTFCRSCIVKYLESNKYCPICDVQVHKTKPLLNIRQDRTIQDLVYKLVPRLYQDEAKRRKTFYESHNTKPSMAEQNVAALYDHILAPDEVVDLILTYHGCSTSPRYFRCACAVTISHLKKLIRLKYDLGERHKVELLFKDDILNPSLSLIDISYIYSWRKKEPIALSYKIYECTFKKPKLDDSTNSSNNNSWKEVQLRISENGEMSITGIQDANDMLDLLDKAENFKSEIVINESKNAEDNVEENTQINAESVKSSEKRKSVPALKPIPKKEAISNGVTVTTSTGDKLPISDTKPTAKDVSEALNLNSVELSVIPLTVTSNCVSVSSPDGTTTVFTTIAKSMCSTEVKTSTATNQRNAKSILKQSNSLKRKNDDSQADVNPSKLPKPTILNHSIGLMNLSNNHPLKKHSKQNRNGEKRLGSEEKASINSAMKPPQTPPPPPPENHSKPIIINKSLSYINNTNLCPKMTKPCYMPKNNSKLTDKTEQKPEVTISIPTSKPSTLYQNHHTPIITPSQLPHHHNSVQRPKEEHLEVKVDTSETKQPSSGTSTETTSSTNSLLATVKSKSNTPIGYKTLRDPPKSWNSQINSQIAKVNQNVKAQQQLAANMSSGGVPGRLGGDLKTVRPPKFFKGRNTPRYLGNPASGVKPLYKVHVSPDKDKNSENVKQEKSEIKKHSIVKIDPKTLKPISEKAPEMSNLSNVSSLNLTGQTNQELRVAQSPGELKINTSSVSIFNPLKLQQSSPKGGERRSPKSPHSPKVKSTNLPGTATSTTTSVSSALSPKQQRDKHSLTFTPPNPFIPNLTSPTLNPNQFLYPTGAGFANYDPRVMAAYSNLWYTQRRMAAVAAAGLVHPQIPHGFNLNFGLPSPTSMSPSHSPGASKPKAMTTTNNPVKVSSPAASQKSPKKLKESPPVKSLENALEKISQSKAKENAKIVAAAAASATVEEPPKMPEQEDVKDTEENMTKLPVEDNVNEKDVKMVEEAVEVVKDNEPVQDVVSDLSKEETKILANDDRSDSPLDELATVAEAIETPAAANNEKIVENLPNNIVEESATVEPSANVAKEAGPSSDLAEKEENHKSPELTPVSDPTPAVDETVKPDNVVSDDVTKEPTNGLAEELKDDKSAEPTR